ncbi:MOSC domain-containing protein [Aquipuribacter hungaricus]|uniref:MOSC domain-containing protein n=1 Tax=Aquipuribacter hungaricus TaxID=545624 RepID=A0ABV7WH70_9MICO
MSGGTGVPTPRSGPGVVEAVCVTHAVKPDPGIIGRTGVDKRPVASVELLPGGVAGDVVADHLHHGGPDKAVYAYASEDAEWWGEQLGHEVPQGWFGENLRLRGVQASDAVLGERWRVGEDAVLEVTQPRTPCATFGRHVGQQRWVRRFGEAGRVGAYLRVLVPGTVRAGDQVVVEHVPAHGVTVRRWFLHRDPEDARALVAAGEQGQHLAPSLVVFLERSLGQV